jgi:hypothetical protein
MQKLKNHDFQRSTWQVCRQARAIIWALLTTAALAPTTIAQDPFVVAPKAYKLQFENDWVRVVRVHYAPFEKLPVHDHPKRQVIFIYLNDGGPVLFKHVEGVSGNYAATRPPTKAGAYRLAGVQPENHEVENLSDVPSDFLQVELKTEMIEPKTFRGRFFPEHPSKQEQGNYRKVEFENPQVRITRMICAARGKCDPLELPSSPALLVALSPLQFKTIGGKPSQLKLELGQAKWMDTGNSWQWQNIGDARAEQLLIEFKSKPSQSTGGAEKQKH